MVAVDWAAVLDVASENAKKAGVADRYTRLPGDALDVSTCTDLLRKVHRSLKEGGLVVTLKFVPNEDRVTPPEQASFSLTMLATTVSGDAYTFEQLESMATDAGFARSELLRLQGPPQAVVVPTK